MIAIVGATGLVGKPVTHELIRAGYNVLTIPPVLLEPGRTFSAQAHYGWHIGEALNLYPEQFESEQT